VSKFENIMATKLETIVEGNTSTMKNIVEEQFRQLSRRIKTKNLTQVSSRSASQIGQEIKSSARMIEILVSVSDEALAEDWKQKAGAHGIQWQAATQPDSSLPESATANGLSIQGLMTSMLKYQSDDDTSTLVLEDVHSKLSVCGSLKPDIIGVVKGLQIPSATGFILDLKTQKEDYLSNENIYQARALNP
jgi:hypothetical protein